VRRWRPGHGHDHRATQLNAPEETDAPREPSLLDALVPLATLVALIGGSLALFGLDALDGPIQVALLLCCMVAALIAMKNGHAWEEVQRSGQGALGSVTSAFFILLAVGALIGTWNLSGTIPTLVFYGIQVLSPSWYYLATALICGVVALSIGSSWTTAGTIGVGLVGIAGLLGVSPAITAGAVISGAYLGDKTSPLSETTILSAQMVKADTFDHIRAQVWTSVPAFALACVAFAVLGFAGPPVENDVSTTVELARLDEIYRITPLNLLPLVLLAGLSIKKVPASLALITSALFAAVLAGVLQPDVVHDFTAGLEDGRGGVLGSVQAGWQAMATGFSMESGIGDIDRLLSRGGMASMLPTLWLIMGAVTFGALLDEFGLIGRLVLPVIAGTRTTGRLFLSVFAVAMGLNIVAGDQYIALVLPTRVFRAEFARRGLDRTNLSRLAADSGTVTSPLVPWNSCGAFMGAVLGVGTLTYLPYCFFNLLSPVLSVAYGFTGFRARLHHRGHRLPHVHRQHAVGHRHRPGRRDHLPRRHDRRDARYRRRGARRAGRRPDPRPRGGPRRGDRHRHADRFGGAGARQGHVGPVRQRPVDGRARRGRRRRQRGAGVGAAAAPRLPPRDRFPHRRHDELRADRQARRDHRLAVPRPLRRRGPVGARRHVRPGPGRRGPRRRRTRLQRLGRPPPGPRRPRLPPHLTKPHEVPGGRADRRGRPSKHGTASSERSEESV